MFNDKAGFMLNGRVGGAKVTEDTGTVGTDAGGGQVKVKSKHENIFKEKYREKKSLFRIKFRVELQKLFKFKYQNINFVSRKNIFFLFFFFLDAQFLLARFLFRFFNIKL
jgi:hypothetical protein